MALAHTPEGAGLGFGLCNGAILHHAVLDHAGQEGLDVFDIFRRLQNDPEVMGLAERPHVKDRCRRESE